MSILHVTVTEADIANGDRDDPCFCPVALAVNRALGAAETNTFVEVDSLDVAYVDTDLHYLWRVDTPGPAARFIRDFDSHGRLGVEPFEFDLEVQP